MLKRRVDDPNDSNVRDPILAMAADEAGLDMKTHADARYCSDVCDDFCMHSVGSCDGHSAGDPDD